MQFSQLQQDYMVHCSLFSMQVVIPAWLKLQKPAFEFYQRLIVWRRRERKNGLSADGLSPKASKKKKASRITSSRDISCDNPHGNHIRPQLRAAFWVSEIRTIILMFIYTYADVAEVTSQATFCSYCIHFYIQNIKHKKIKEMPTTYVALGAIIVLHARADTWPDMLANQIISPCPAASTIQWSDGHGDCSLLRRYP